MLSGCVQTCWGLVALWAGAGAGECGMEGCCQQEPGGTDTSTVVLPGGAGMCGQGLVCVWERDSSTEQFCR